MRKMILVTVCLIFALSTSISAAPGDLDPTFGSGGIVITTSGASLTLYTAWAMAIQSDGKIVVVGEGATPPFDNYNWDFTVVRYNPDGSQDSSFGGTGIVITPLGNRFDLATSVGIQSDGKIVVAGSSGPNFALVRYNTDGSLDTSFNGTGKVITSVGSSGGAESVAIQANGKIVVAGRSWNGSTSSFALVRYNADHTAAVRTDERAGVGLRNTVCSHQQHAVPGWTTAKSNEHNVHGRLQHREGTRTSN